MSVTVGDVKLFLQSAGIYKSLLEESKSLYLTFLERATKTTTHITGMPKGGGSRDQVYVELIAAKAKVDSWQLIEESNLETLTLFLREAPLDDTQRTILQYRYLRLMKWADVAYTLKTSGFEMSDRTMYYTHNKALDALADWVNHTAKYKKEISG